MKGRSQKKEKTKKKGTKEKTPDPEDIRVQVEGLKRLGIATGTLKKPLQSYERSFKGNGKSLQQNWEKLETKLDQLMEKWKQKKLDISLDMAEKALEAIKEKDLDDEKFTKKIDHIRKKTSKEGTASALDRLSTLRSEMEAELEDHPDIIVPEAWSSLEKALDTYEDIVTSSSEIKESKKHFKRTMNYMKKGNIDKVLVYANLLYTTVQKELSEDVVKDRFKNIREEVKNLMKTMEEFKKFGIAPEGINTELSKLEEHMEPSKYKDAQTIINRVNKNISRMEKEYFRRKGNVSLIEAKQLIEEFGSLLDLKEKEKNVKKLMEDQTTISPKKLLDESQKVLSDIREILFENFVDQVKERSQHLEKQNDAVKGLSRSDIKEIRTLQRSVEEALERRDITQAMDYLSLAESMMNRQQTDTELVEVHEEYSGFLDRYETLVERDIEIKDLKEQISELEDMFLDDDLKGSKILEGIKDAENMIKDRLIDIRRADLEKEKEEVLDTLSKLGFNQEKIDHYVSSFDQIGSQIEKLDEDDYMKKIGSIRSELEKDISSYFRENYDNWAKRIQTDIEKLRNKDVDTRPLQENLDDAGRSYREREYLRSGELLRTLDQEIARIEDEFNMRDAEELINSAEFLYEEASRAGVDVEEQKVKLENAKELLSDGEPLEAANIAKDAEGEVRERWMQMKKELLKDDLDGLKDYISESTTLGLDISDAVDLMEEAESLFKEEKFEEVNEVVGRAKERVEQNRNNYFSEGAMNSIRKLKDDISSLSDMGVNTLEAETMLIEAEKLFMNEDYEAAYSVTLDIREQLTQAKEGHLNETIPREMDEVLTKIGRLEVMGLETGSANKYIENAENRREEGDLVGTLNELKKAREISDEIFKSHISLTIPETIVDVKRQIDETSMEGLEMNEIQDMLDEAEEMFQKEEYDNAMSTIEMAQTQFENKRNSFYKEQFETNLDSVEEVLGQASGLDIEKELSRDNINMAKDAYERGDYQASHKLLDKVMKFIDRSMEEREVGRRREVVQTYFDEVNTLITVAESENIDVNEEKQLLSFAGDLMIKGDLDQAEHVIEGIKVGVHDKRLQMKKNLIESSIKTTEILLQNMRDMGIDTSYESSLVTEIKEALRKGDLDLCDQINAQLQEALSKNQGPYLIQKVQRELSDLRAKVVEANSKGIEIADVQAGMSEATELFELGDIEGAERKIQDANDLLKRTYMDFDVSEYEELRSNLQERITQLENMGIPVDDELELMKNAEEKLQEEKLDEAKEWLQTAFVGANAKINSFQSTTAEGYIAQIDNYLKDLSQQGIDTTELESIYQEGLVLHNEGSDEKAVGKFSSILELGEELRTLHDLNLMKERFEEQNSLYEDLRSVGSKPSKKLEKVMDTVRKLLKKDTTDTAELGKALNKIDKVLDKRVKPHLEKLTKKHISEASMGYRELRKEGNEDKEIPDLIKQAGERFREEDFKAADKMAMQALRKVEAIKKDEIGQVLREEIESVKQMLTRLKTLGSNVSEAEKLLSRAEAAIEEGKMEPADNLISSVRQTIKEIVKRNMRETALETIEFTDAMIHYLLDNFSGVSQQLEPAEALLDEARGLFKDKKFKTAKFKAEEARDAVERMELQNITQFLYVFRSMQGEEILRNASLRIEELRDKGIDTSKAEMLYGKAKDHFDADEYDKGRQMITLARILLSELDQQSLRDNAFDELNSAHVEILSKKKKGTNVTKAYKIYNNAKEAFSMRDYKRSILLSKKASYQARKAASKKK